MTTTPARFLFRCAAGPRIGFGHLMRCGALARALDVRPLISVRGSSAARRTVRTLKFDLAVDLDLSDVDVVVVDDPSPRHAEAWLVKAKRAGAATATIHDLGIGSGVADLVVDGSITAHRPSRDLNALRGPRFTVVDPRLLRARAACRPRRLLRRPRVLIALGGGSHVLSVVQSLVHDLACRCPGAAVTVAAGFCQGPRPPLGAARWIDRPDGLAWDLARSDVAIVGGGVTLYEACAVGVPVVALSLVPTQRATIEAFARHGAAIDGGALTAAMAVGGAGAAAARLIGDWSARRRRAAAARRLIDGRGALRLATRLRSLAASRNEPLPRRHTPCIVVG